VVKGLDAPVPSEVVGEAGGAGLGGGEVGDRVHGRGAPALAVQGPDPAGDADRLGGVREAEAVQGRRRQQLAAPSARRVVATELIGREVPGADARVYAPADSCCWG